MLTVLLPTDHDGKGSADIYGAQPSAALSNAQLSTSSGHKGLEGGILLRPEESLQESTSSGGGSGPRSRVDFDDLKRSMRKALGQSEKVEVHIHDVEDCSPRALHMTIPIPIASGLGRLGKARELKVAYVPFVTDVSTEPAPRSREASARHDEPKLSRARFIGSRGKAGPRRTTRFAESPRGVASSPPSASMRRSCWQRQLGRSATTDCRTQRLSPSSSPCAMRSDTWSSFRKAGRRLAFPLALRKSAKATETAHFLIRCSAWPT